MLWPRRLFGELANLAQREGQSCLRWRKRLNSNMLPAPCKNAATYKANAQTDEKHSSTDERFE